MRSTIVLMAAFVTAFFAAGTVNQISEARTQTQTLKACQKAQDKISAEKLPSEVSLDKCPVGDRPIVDNGVEATLPEAGEGVYAEVLTSEGSQELVVTRRDDGTVELNKVGDEAEASAAEKAEAVFYGAGRGPDPCRDRAYNLTRWKVYDRIAYRYNYRSTPRYLSRKGTGRAIRRAGANVVKNRNSCGIGDRVEAGLAFKGGTRRGADIRTNGRCTRSDAVSVVSFGRLNGSPLAVTCTYFTLRNGYDRVTSSDIKIDRSNSRWTTRPRARSCKRAFDIESAVTHEFGHSFGLGHVGERRYPNLTMSTRINGPCQASERTMGRGDVRGLTRKYR